MDVGWARRATVVQEGRIRAAQTQAKRTALLPLDYAFRKQVAGGLLVAGGMYASSVHGLSPTKVHRMRERLTMPSEGGTEVAPVPRRSLSLRLTRRCRSQPMWQLYLPS